MPTLKQDQINPLNSLISPEEIEAFVNSLPSKNKTKQTNKHTKKQIHGPVGFVGNSI